METEALTRIMVLAVCIGIVHWTIVPMALERLFDRPKVIGSKFLWGVAIVSVTCLGSLAYLLLHPDEENDAGLNRGCCRDN